MRHLRPNPTVLLASLAAVLAVSIPGWAQKGKPPGPPTAPPDPAIAYVNERGNAILVVNTDGSNVTTVYQGRSIYTPDWSPDGKQLVFQAESKGLWIVNVNGTGLKTLPNTINDYMMHPAWSPQPTGGLPIAYRADWPDPSGNGDIFLTDVNGTRNVNCTNNSPEFETGPSWSPDGTRLAVVSGADLLVFTVAPDNQGAATCTLLLNLTSASTPPFDSISWDVDWSKDPAQRDQIALVARRNGVIDLWVVNADDPYSFHNLTNGCCQPRSPSWSPDNSKLLFLDANTGGLRTITTDGTAVVYDIPLPKAYRPNWSLGAAWRRNK